ISPIYSPTPRVTIFLMSLYIFFLGVLQVIIWMAGVYLSTFSSKEAFVIGVTGWPGVGESSLINRMGKAFKAGILEMADVFVVNKADRIDADKTVQDLEYSLRLRKKPGWNPPVIKGVRATDMPQ
ncbi:MAG: hypothetical protein Q8K46_05550, partial [Deltaproteobacteria bacterium]|nr:hypothetical protein [Deltaproteobacteria bacterium]